MPNCWRIRRWMWCASPRRTGCTCRRRSMPSARARMFIARSRWATGRSSIWPASSGEETRKLKRIVQVGNQGNSSPAWGQVRELVQQGAIGRLQLVQAGFYRDGDWGERMPIADPDAVPGPDLDWEAFLGDAPKVPFTRAAVLQLAEISGLCRRAQHGPVPACAYAARQRAGADFPRPGGRVRRHLQIHDLRPRSARHVQHVPGLPGEGLGGAGVHFGQRIYQRPGHSR